MGRNHGLGRINHGRNMGGAKMIAIHGNSGFAKRWPGAADAQGVPWTRVDAYADGLFENLDSCTHLLWSLNQDDPRDLDYAASILTAVEQRGVRVFPNYATRWHFDDKVAQSYMLEGLGAPLARTWVFFELEEALAHIEGASFPLVFKLRRGAGALNVRLVRKRSEARRLVRKMFGRGLRSYPPGGGMIRGLQRGLDRERAKAHQDGLLARVPRAATRWWRNTRYPSRERGYALFQEFLRGNAYDTRVTVIGDRIFTYRRENRPNDFRASGSGRIIYLEPELIPMDLVECASRISDQCGFQSMAYDFVREDSTGAIRLLEMSFTFVPRFVRECPGYFTRGGSWVAGHHRPEDLILKDCVAELYPIGASPSEEPLCERTAVPVGAEENPKAAVQPVQDGD